MNLKKRAQEILKRLKKQFPNAEIELVYEPGNAWQLLVVVMLSAQTTDKKVNAISKSLFKRFPDPKATSKATSLEVEPYLKSIGLFRNKSKNLIATAKKIMTDFHGCVPKTRDELETLPGIGKKSSAVVVSNVFSEPAMAVDTHVTRVSRRLGLTDSLNPEQIEKELTALWSKKNLFSAHNTLVLHGRYICVARKPHCTKCPLFDICPRIGVKSFK